MPLILAFKARFCVLRRMVPYVGFWGILVWHVAEDWNRVARRVNDRWQIREVRIRIKGYDRSVAVRPSSSDFEVLQQVFVFKQYLPSVCIENASVIVDCGANAGYSSIFFLKHFPHARVIALEPDPPNAALCRKNLQQYGDRAIVLEKALWGSVTELTFVEETRVPGEEWGVQVRPCEPSTSSRKVEAIDVPDLMASTNVESIDLLKIDIEKSETEVFRCNPSRWLHLVRNIAIELHGPACTEVFRTALEGFSFKEEQCEEVTFCFGLEATGERLTSRIADSVLAG
jgi:FkbM family methyltransferase